MDSVSERSDEQRRRRERLAASLRENLKRRKAQQRARAGAAPLQPRQDPAGPTSGAGEG